MDNTGNSFSLRSILWVVVAIGIMFGLLLGLHQLDKRKKRTHFREIVQQVEQADAVEQLSKKLPGFKPDDSIDVEEIKEYLRVLEDDVPHIAGAKVYVPDSGRFYMINSNGHRYVNPGFQTVNYLPEHTRQFIRYLESIPDPDPDSLYKLSENGNRFEILFLLEGGFLKVYYYRN